MSFHSGRKQCARAGMFVDKTSHTQTEKRGTFATLGPALSGDLSTLFDVGGIVGGIAAGVVSDYTGMYATTCSVMLTFAAPMLLSRLVVSELRQWLLLRQSRS
uniref:Uncharacterized protein n=2 Tax=Timema TaxID=61471 RepID=A0A7R9B5E2_TIMSH|nr:unnamed protein product [Timema shepardi]CAD7572711.1 unnamed protein product [Timema californicum]